MLDLNVDPATLEEQLVAARAGRAQLDRVIAWLEDGVEIFAGAPAPAELPAVNDQDAKDTVNAGGGSPSEEPPEPPAELEVEPEPAAEPVRPSRPRPPVSAGARDLEGKVLSVILKANHPLAPRDIAKALDVDAQGSSFRRALKRLVDGGQIEGHGQRTARRYAKIKVREFHSEMRSTQEASAQRNRLESEDRVGRVVFRDTVLKAIAADPACLTIDRLALALGADLADVTEACTWLVEHHQAQQHDDGTYSRSAPRRARLRAAA